MSQACRCGKPDASQYQIKKEDTGYVPRPERHHGIEQYIRYLSIFQLEFYTWLVEERMVLVMDMLEVKEHEFSAKVVSW